jgi:hypothetical protein
MDNSVDWTLIFLLAVFGWFISDIFRKESARIALMGFVLLCLTLAIVAAHKHP